MTQKRFMNSRQTPTLRHVHIQNSGTSAKYVLYVKIHLFGQKVYSYCQSEKNY